MEVGNISKSSTLVIGSKSGSGNATTNNSYSWAEFQSSKLALGGPYVELRYNSSTSSSGSVALQAKSGYSTLEGNWALLKNTGRYRNLFVTSHPSFSPRLYIRRENNDNNVSCYASTFNGSSDDRLKTNEVMIENATTTLNKLKPQTYTKYGEKESGLIAQDVYYDTPELRHLVTLPVDENDEEITPLKKTEEDDDNIQNDPDYEALGCTGDNYASLNYQGLIPYLVKAVQELNEKVIRLEEKYL